MNGPRGHRGHRGPTGSHLVVTAHQPNFLPGASVIRKVDQADAVIWLDEVQYSHGGWSNRNRMPDGSWLTVPVDRTTDMEVFNRVKLSDHGTWRNKHVATVEQHFNDHPAIQKLIDELYRPYRLLVGLNLALLRVVLNNLHIDTPWHFQSHLDSGHAVVAVSDDREELAPISERLAMMVAELGGSIYLSGPSGRHYLDERPFHDRRITVDYFEWDGRNDCVLELAADRAA